MGDLILGVILQYMVSAAFSCFLQSVKVVPNDVVIHPWHHGPSVIQWELSYAETSILGIVKHA